MNLHNKILSTLKYEQERISINDFDVIPSYFYSTIADLIDRDLIKPFINPKDARKRYYMLTENGQKHVNKIKGMFV
jgi:DNA-binding MarR family transcriptional regulator